jgi:hypothetical protein
MLRSVLSLLLSLLMTLPAMASPADQNAGEVKALIPNAARNSQPLAVRDTLQWKDLLTTNAKGRLRAQLTDGSILSLGSNGQLQVVQHDANSQQTALQLDYGKLRNQVVKITQPGGKYEVKTPNAVIGVIGTDFYVAYGNNRTTVICYDGVVTVTPGEGAAVVAGSNATQGSNNPITLNAGQMVVIGNREQPGAYQATTAAPPLMQASMRDTSVPDVPLKTVAGSSHRTRIIVISALAVTAGLTVALTQINSSSKPCGCK